MLKGLGNSLISNTDKKTTEDSLNKKFLEIVGLMIATTAYRPAAGAPC
jgi:hypothetical protein